MIVLRRYDMEITMVVVVLMIDEYGDRNGDVNSNDDIFNIICQNFAFI